MKKTGKDKLDGIADSLLMFFPVFYRKLIRGWDDKSAERPLSHHRYMILSMITNCGPLSMSDIGRRLCLSKPHMTMIMDGLIEEGMMERLHDAADRRVIRIAITGTGKEYMNGYRKHAKETIKRNLSQLTEDDIETLFSSIRDIRAIFSKLGVEKI